MHPANVLRRVSAIVCTAVLAGCATMPPVTSSTAMCNFSQRTLVVNDPLWKGGASRQADTEGVAVGSPSPRRTGIPKPTLVLSGGGQNGAFGAGFLKRWADRSPGGKLPEFGLVTGISTGAILSTWAFIGEPDVVAGAYRITSESQLLHVYKKPAKGGGLGAGAALTLLRKNSLADLDPLRDRLRQEIDRETLRKVSEEPGRLQVGAVEVDTGDMVLFDLKGMAKRAVRNDEASPEFKHLRDCYVDAIMASSSVPLGARPVFIDNRMFIDGGARFGVFVDYLKDVTITEADSGAEALVGDEAAASQEVVWDRSPATGKVRAPAVYILMNGTQWVSLGCSKLDEADCRGGALSPDPYQKGRPGAHKKWQIAGLAFRANDILVNQVYRFSADRVYSQYALQYPANIFDHRLYFARMHRSDLISADQFAYNGKSCDAARKEDKAKLNPLEFYPTYMACLEAYGEQQADALGWFGPSPASRAVDRAD